MKQLIITIWLVGSISIAAQQEKRDTAATKKIETVTLTKKAFQKKNDRFIIDIATQPSTKGNSAFNVLKQTPLISTMDDKTLRIAGKSNAVIYINGRKNQMDADALATFLKSIPAENIQKIEIITVPGSEYQVESSDGIINIILKKKTDNGINGNLRFSNNQGYHNNPGAIATVIYRKNNLGISAGFNTRDYTKQQYYRLSNGNISASNQTEGSVTEPNKTTGGYFNLDYTLNEKSNLALSYNTLYSKNSGTHSELFNTVKVFKNQIWETDHTITRNNENAQSYNNFLNLNYELKADSLSKLSLNIAYLNFKKSQNSTNGTYDSGNQPTDGYRSLIIQNTPQVINNLSASIDYSRTLKKGAALSFGGNYNFTKTNNNTQNQTYRSDTGIMINNPNQFIYTENIFSLYLTFEKKFNDKFFGKIGTRYELTQSEGDSSHPFTESLRNIKRNYHNILPYLNLNYAINKDHNLSYSFSSRMKRPSFWEVNPVKTYLTEVNYVQNNPLVKASSVYSQELTYMYKSAFFFVAAHKYYQDVISQVPLQGTLSVNNNMTNVLRYIRTNFGNRQELNFSLGLQKSIFKQYWNTNINVGIQHNINDGTLDTDPLTGEKFPLYVNSIKSTGITIQTNNTIRLDKPKTWYLGINYWYVSNYQIELGQLKPLGSLELSLKKIWNDWTFMATVQDVFNTNRVIIEDSQQNGNYNYINIYNYPRQFEISMTYNFGNKKVKKIREINNASEDIKNRTK
ncbi:MAG: TonB-dependent receptor domain-containing protein [Chryseobacterium jejuense]|uniref:TonB-dependent receptor domain-containing protein n=1 Tax=Chryseobacterium jejuense TaxID=445960 RepID=UPI003D0D0BC6